MNDFSLVEKIKIEDMIYNVRDKQVMLDSEISATKCHRHLYDKMITHCDIGKSISVFNNYESIICTI